MPLMYALLVAVFLIGLIAALVFASKHWHWLHITAVVLVFLTAIPAVYTTGFVMKTRAAEVSLAKNNAAAAEAARDRYDDVLYGAEPGPDAGYGVDSRNAVLVKLKRLNIGKGRTWENASVSGIANNQVTFSIPQPAPAEGAPADDAAADLTGHYPTNGSLIYVFSMISENGSDGQAMAIPGEYLGSFRVNSVGDQQIAASPELLLTGNLQNATPVYIYEKPPTDFHGAMYRAMGLDEDITKTSIDDVRAKFAEVFPIDSLGMTPEAYNDLLNEVSFDRRPISAIDNWLQAKNLGSWEPSPQEVMVKVKVLQDMSVQVNGTQDLHINGEYDSLGRTNIPQLKLENDSATVKKSKEGDDTDFWLVDEPTASLGFTSPDGEPQRSLEETGEVDVIERLYYRPLRDYTTEIGRTIQNVQLLNDRIAEYDRYLENAAFLQDRADTQERVRDDKISKLTQDQDNLKRDIAALDSYSAELETKLAQLKQQMRDTYLQISYIHQQRKNIEDLLPPPAN